MGRFGVAERPRRKAPLFDLVAGRAIALFVPSSGSTFAGRRRGVQTCKRKALCEIFPRSFRGRRSSL